MGKVWSKTTRPFRGYNALDRTLRELDKQQTRATVAPKHPSSQKQLSQVKQEYPEVIHEVQRKDENLLLNLKNVKVDSFGPAPEIPFHHKLPEKRRLVQDHYYGVTEPSIIPPGKVTLPQMMEIINGHYLNPKEQTLSRLSRQYNINEAVLEQVFKHYIVMRYLSPTDIEDGLVLESQLKYKREAESRVDLDLNEMSNNSSSDKNDGKSTPKLSPKS